ncbi:MAG: DNA repair protein RecN [Bacteroidetes bacterium]|nr:DNA repair protein RecN [Bacteroidota bacterium]
MLVRLAIENYALIDRLEMELSAGFSIITGETGAGKSILLGALSLILGNRGDASVLLDKSRKCIVEGAFRIKGYRLEDFFSGHELDYDETAILRREILQNGKSRAFINDTPVNLTLMKELGDRLVNVHSQFSIITLNDADFQLAVLDNYSENNKIIPGYREEFALYTQLNRELDQLVRQETRARSDRDYYQFLFEEFETARLQDGEQEQTEQRLELLAHASEIKNAIFHALEVLSEGEQNVLARISEIAGTTGNLSRFHPSLNEISERLRSNNIDLRDIAGEMEKIGQAVEFDPAEIAALTARLDLIYHLEKKHNVPDIAGLQKIQREVEDKLKDVTSLEERIGLLKKEIDLLKEKLENQAEELSANRHNVTGDLEEKIRQTLVLLGMPDARISIELKRRDELTADGTDAVRFLFSANKGIALNEIAKIASGGELSRLMLTIKSLVSQRNLLPTIIFDEIDMGVSGEVAGKVGDILKKMGQTMQVIAITHLPQIAGKGQSHYWVYKTSDDKTARTLLKKLNPKERVHEIAKMLSNEKVSDAALKTAKELMGN